MMLTKNELSFHSHLMASRQNYNYDGPQGQPQSDVRICSQFPYWSPIHMIPEFPVCRCEVSKFTYKIDCSKCFTELRTSNNLIEYYLIYIPPPPPPPHLVCNLLGYLGIFQLGIKIKVPEKQFFS